jgi:hypothetical protein
MFAWSLPARQLSEAAWVAFLAIFNIFFILAMFATLSAAQSMAGPAVDLKENATYDPEASEQTQPAVHKRFTYAGSTGLQVSQHLYTSENPAWPLASPKSPKWPFSSPTKMTFGFGHAPTNTVQHAF